MFATCLYQSICSQTPSLVLLSSAPKRAVGPRDRTRSMVRPTTVFRQSCSVFPWSRQTRPRLRGRRGRPEIWVRPRDLHLCPPPHQPTNSRLVEISDTRSLLTMLDRSRVEQSFDVYYLKSKSSANSGPHRPSDAEPTVAGQRPQGLTTLSHRSDTVQPR